MPADTQQRVYDLLHRMSTAGLNTVAEVDIVGIARDGFLQTRIGQMPYLNGGLFEQKLNALVYAVYGLTEKEIR